MDGSSAAYLAQLQALLPSGAAWSRDPDAVLTRLLAAIADGFAAIHARSNDLLEEAHAGSAVELLADWERVLGLPDACTGTPDTLAGRQRLALARLTARGGQSRAYYIGLAATLGYEIEITEHRTMTCEDACDAALDPYPWNHVWEVNAPAVTVHYLDCLAGGCDEPLRSWGNAALECALSRLKPAQTLVRFVYGDA